MVILIRKKERKTKRVEGNTYEGSSRNTTRGLPIKDIATESLRLFPPLNDFAMVLA